MSKIRIALNVDMAPKPKRSREDNLKIIAECNRLIEQLRLKRDRLPDGI